VAVVLLVLTAAACGTRGPALAHAAESPQALASAVVAALERKDGRALGDLAVSEQEFRDHVWPELPAARPERNLPFSYVWMDLKQKSDGHLARTVEEFGGRGWRVASVRFAGGTTQYETYLVHRDGRLTLVAEDGTTREVALFGSVLEKDGRYKVFSYVTD
jgi:predicted small lipoprotein YifL